MNEGSREEKTQAHTKATNYASEEARNVYNSLLLRNATAKQDISAYAQRCRDKAQYKSEIEQIGSKDKKANGTNILPVDSEKTSDIPTQLVSTPRFPSTFSNLTSCFNR